jgi:mannose-1-phosphate guanylyltransferase / mannose-6-phosphate isomerase
MQQRIIPVIVAGGAGTRLWPLSRGQSPKQFLRLGQNSTLLHQTLNRCRGACFDMRPIIVGSDDNRGQLLNVVQNLGIEADLVLEPFQRNTCAAIAAGTLRALERDPEALVLILAADHHIPDATAFQTTVEKAIAAARRGMLVTFGVKPRYAATGYGYILPHQIADQNAVSAVARFVEKPDAATAERYVLEGYLWNSGNFLFSATAFLSELRQTAPVVLEAVREALNHAQRDRDFIRLAPAYFEGAPKISVDYAVMEKTTKAAVMAVDYAWGDVGTWDAVANSIEADVSRNAIVGRGVITGSKNVMIHSEDLLTTVIGVDDIVVVTTRDAILVVRKGQTENVKTLVERLRAEAIAEADAPLPGA